MFVLKKNNNNVFMAASPDIVTARRHRLKQVIYRIAELSGIVV